jgi:hypothetical protein
MGRRLGKARSLALLHPEGFVLDVVQRGQTLDIVLDDFRASWLLGHFGFSGEARWTLSFKKCERVEWLIEEMNYRGKTRSRLRPATMQEVISLWREAKTWSDFEYPTGIHLRAGWVLNRRQPLQWAGRMESNYLVVTCDRAVVIDQREESMRRIGGREMAELWRRYLEDATMFGYPFGPEWVRKQGDSPLKGGRPGGASK